MVSLVPHATIEARREYAREHYKKNREKILVYKKEHNTLRRAHLKRKFGLSLDDYNKMSAEQNHVCYICGETSKRRLAVDHCHQTNKIRKLLCGECNLMLGKAKDNPVLLRKAIAYLEQHV